MMMSKGSGKVQVSELVKILRREGWYLHHHGGRHDQYRHPAKPGQLSIERHAKEVTPGTLNRILKLAGLK